MELASKPQRMSSLTCRRNHHLLTNLFHGLGFEDCSTKFPWTSCRSSGHGPLTKGLMGVSWSLIGQLGTRGPVERHGARDTTWPWPSRTHAPRFAVAVFFLDKLDLPIWMSYAAWTTAKLVPSIHAWRHRQLRAITMLSRAVGPLRSLVRGMPVDVRERAEKWNVVLIAAMVPLLRWPDRRLAVCFAEGFCTIRCVESSSVFRSLAKPIEPLDGSTDCFSGRRSCAVCG